MHLETPSWFVKKDNVGTIIKKSLKSKFQLFWKDQVSKTNIGNDGLDHNGLRFYKTFKSSFTREPYLDLINNRNQRCWLSRLGLGAPNPEIQVGCYNNIKVSERFCGSCDDNVLGDESHTLLSCKTFKLKQALFLR